MYLLRTCILSDFIDIRHGLRLLGRRLCLFRFFWVRIAGLITCCGDVCFTVKYHFAAFFMQWLHVPAPCENELRSSDVSPFYTSDSSYNT